MIDKVNHNLHCARQVLDELLGLQQHICGFGRDHRFDAKGYLVKRRTGTGI